MIISIISMRKKFLYTTIIVLIIVSIIIVTKGFNGREVWISVSENNTDVVLTSCELVSKMGDMERFCQEKRELNTGRGDIEIVTRHEFSIKYNIGFENGSCDGIYNDTITLE